MLRRGAAGYQKVPSKDDTLPTVRSGHTPRKEPPSKTQPQRTQPGGSNGRPFKLSDYRVESEDYASLQMASKVPYAGVALAVFLMLLGMVCFVAAWLHITQEILGKEQAEYGFTIIGLLTFIPGFYHTRIAYYCWKRTKGYSWDMIPAM